MLKVIHTKSFQTIIFVATLALATMISSNLAHADTFKTNVDIAPKLNVTVPSTPTEITLDPSSQPFDYEDLDVTVSTNNYTGYYMTMSSSTTNLVKKEDSSKYIETLPALDGGYTNETFVTNKWGYKIGTSGNYQPFVSGIKIAESDTTTNADTTTIRLATKIDFLQSSGTYEIELNFVAVVNPLPEPDITFATYMQDVTPAMAEATAIGTSKTLKDKRDDEEYLVEKLADGNIWMLDNLRLDPTTVSLETLQGDTNATDEILAYLKNGGGPSPYPANGVIAKTADGGSWSDSYDNPYVATGYKDTVASTTYGEGSGKIGVYYNYCAASAGSYCYAENAGTSNTTYDICPTGWRLPKGGAYNDSSNEFNNLYLAYGSDQATFKEALSTPLSGDFSSGSAYLQGSYGYFWSSTFYYSRHMRYLLTVRSSIVSPVDDDDRSRGLSVRCILN